MIDESRTQKQIDRSLQDFNKMEGPTACNFFLHRTHERVKDVILNFELRPQRN